MTDVLALADDTTGALEVGAQFAECGLPAAVCFVTPKSVEGRALVLDTRSRHLNAVAAADSVRQALAHLAVRPRFIFKKTDSTLRGPVAAECRALQEACPGRPVVYAPAYPALGRTVRGGRLYIWGEPVEHTAFAHDALNPVLSGDVRALFDGPVSLIENPRELRHALETVPAETVLVCDGCCDRDLAATAEVLRQSGRPVIAAGPGAFVRAWAAELPAARTIPPPLPRASGGVFVCGSRHPVSLGQLAGASSRLSPTTAWSVLTPETDWAGAAHEIAARLAARAAEALRNSDVEALVVFGGDTAAAVLTALGVDRMTPCGELLPGVPISLIETPRRLVLVTKAGGFGDPDIVESITRKLGG